MANIHTGQLANYVEGLADITRHGLANLSKETMLDTLFDVRTTNKKTVREQDIENTTSAGMVPEGGLLPELSFAEGYPQAYTVNQYGAVMGITELMRMTDQREIIADMNEQLMLAVRDVTETLVADYLDYGDVTTGIPQLGGQAAVRTVGNDGLSLFNAAHKYASNSGYTYRNKSASADSPSETSIDTAYRVLRRWQDNAGRPLNVNMVKLLGPPELETAFIKALESRLEPTSANNAVNTAPKLMKGSYQIWNRLSSTTRWYVETDAKGDTNFKWFWLKKPTLEVLEKIDTTKNKYFCVNMWAAHGGSRVLRWHLVG